SFSGVFQGFASSCLAQARFQKGGEAFSWRLTPPVRDLDSRSGKRRATWEFKRVRPGYGSSRRADGAPAAGRLASICGFPIAGEVRLLPGQVLRLGAVRVHMVLLCLPSINSACYFEILRDGRRVFPLLRVMDSISKLLWQRARGGDRAGVEHAFVPH